MEPQSTAPQTPADTVAAAQRLWQQGEFAQARRQIAQALRRGETSRRLKLAAWAFQDCFAQPLTGAHVSVERRSPADLPFVRAAWADRSFMDRFHRLASPLPASDDALREILAREEHSTLLDRRNLHWTIRAGNPREAVGLVSLVEISLEHARAEFIIGVRGAAAGSALEAALLVLEFAFSVLSLRKVTASVYGPNEYALRSVQHLGFTREALLREHVRDPRSGEFVDLCLLALWPRSFAAAANQRLAQRLLGRALRAERGEQRRDRPTASPHPPPAGA